MDSDLATVFGNLLIVGLMVLGLLSPTVFFVGLFWLARRHLAGWRSRFARLFGGIGRADAMNSHLQAGTPKPDDLAVPVPPSPGPRPVLATGAAAFERTAHGVRQVSRPSAPGDRAQRWRELPAEPRP